MKISRVHIHNYRSIKDTAFDCGGYCTLLGQNNHGKSNIIKAIGLMMDGEDLKADDFHNDTQEAWVEVTFSDLNEHEQNGLKKYLLAPDFKSIKVRAVWKKEGKNKVSHHGYINWPSQPVFKQIAQKSGDMSACLELLQNTEVTYEGGKKKDFKEVMEAVAKYLESHPADSTEPLLDTWNKFQGFAAKSELPAFHFVPAVRDVSDELKLKTTTLFGRIFNDILDSDTEDQQIKGLRDALRAAFENLKADKSIIGRVSEAIRNELPGGWKNDVQMRIDVTAPELADIYEKCLNLLVNDGMEGRLANKGHGLQRALLFAMTKAWAKAASRKSANSAGPSLIMAIEEPELYLHPHAQEAFMRSIKELAKQGHFQVFVCTHSPMFVELGEYKNILIAEKTAQDGTRVRQVTTELFSGDEALANKYRFNMAYWLNPDRSRLFFARKAVLVEGHTEAAVLPLMAERLEVFDYEVSIIDCGGKNNLKTYIKLCKEFQIPYHVIHDEDPVDESVTNADKLQSMRETFAENAVILAAANGRTDHVSVIKGQMEEMLGLPKNPNPKISKPMQAVNRIMGMDKQKIEEELSALSHIIKAAYAASMTGEVAVAA